MESVEPMNMPKRIQRRRTKGWRLPPASTCVTRPGKWGNPFETAAEFRDVLELLIEGRDAEAKEHCDDEQFARMRYIAANVRQLRGFNLACFCGLDRDCHGDVLLEFANK